MLTGLAPGSLIAGYRLESRLGAGGMAVVFRARDERLGRAVALKILAPTLASDQEFRERFVRESRAVAAVDHPHIIPVYAAGEAGGVLYLAMRFVSGGDLRSIVQREGPLPGERAIFVLSPIADALDAAHHAGLMHRDVKPANILIDSSPGRPDHPYLSDFGLAKGAASSAGLTGTGQFLGTPDFAAPEQISGKPARPQTDQYALACVAYTILSGTLPFSRDESMAVLWAHMYESPPSLTARRPDLPPSADQVLARALAKAPEDRYATCGEFTDALRDALSTAPRPKAAAGRGSSLSLATAAADWPRRPGKDVYALAGHTQAATPYPVPASGQAPPAAVRPALDSFSVPPFGDPAVPVPPGPGRRRGDDGKPGKRRPPAVTGWLAALALITGGGLGFYLHGMSQNGDVADPSSRPAVTPTVTVTEKRVVRTITETPVPGGAPVTMVTTMEQTVPAVTVTKTATVTKAGVVVTVTATPAVTVTQTVTTTTTVTATPTVTVTVTPTPPPG